MKIAGCFFIFSLISFSGLLYSAVPVGKITFNCKVRDFKEYYDVRAQGGGNALIPGGHPDFEHYWGAGCKGAVENHIDTNGSHTSFPFDHRNPRFKEANGCPQFYNGPDYFYSWYNDTTSDINRSFLVPLEFTLYDNCVLKYINRAFFPIDDGGSFVSSSDPPLPTFGHLQTNYPEHNFGFTMEFHMRFVYSQGAGQTFSFTGDDDVWVFMNDSLVIDLSGLHSALSATVYLDKFRYGFLEDGHEYMLDFFSAERQATASNIQITTSLLLTPPDTTEYYTKAYVGAAVCSEVSKGSSTGSVLPERFSCTLSPAPLDGQGQIRMRLESPTPLPDRVNVEMLNIQGQCLKILNLENRGNAYIGEFIFKNPLVGYHGCYFVRLRLAETNIIKKLMLL